MMPRVLVVDDNDSIRRLVSRVLAKKDIDVDESFDGADALHKLQEVDYDAVLLDLMMPRKSGFEVIRALKSRPALLKRFIVMTAATGKTTDEILDQVHTVVTKPFSIAELADLVTECIETSSEG